MCGLVAVLALNKTGVSWEDQYIFKDLMYASVVRGQDGCGMFYVADDETWNKHDGVIGWAKHPEGPVHLFRDKEIKGLQEAIANSRFLVGHTRYATVGKVEVKNNHPFIKDHITMVHNGTLRYIDHPSCKLGDFEVDSAALCDLLSRMPAEQGLKKVFGAIAMIWYDSKERKLKVYRNTERSLYYVHMNNRYYFASEAGTLSWIVPRHRANKMEVPTLVDPYTIYSFTHEDAEPDKKLSNPYDRSEENNISRADDEEGLFSWFNRKKGETGKVFDDKAVVISMTKKERKKYKSLDEYFGLRKGDRLVLTPTNREWDKSSARYTISFELLANATNTGSLSSTLRDVSFLLQTKLTDAEDIFKADVISATAQSIVINKRQSDDVKVFLSGAIVRQPEGHA